MNRGRRMLGVCSREDCGEIFSRRPCDLRRAGRPYCCRRCFEISLATGPVMKIYTCAGCGVPVERARSQVKRRKKVFCSLPCYRQNGDFENLGRLGGSAPHAPLAPGLAAVRSRKGGFARAAALSPERLRAIAMLGVAARTSASAIRAKLSRLAGPTVVLGVRLGRRA